MAQSILPGCRCTSRNQRPLRNDQLNFLCRQDLTGAVLCIVGGYGKCEVRHGGSSRGQDTFDRYSTTILRHLGLLINLTVHNDILHRESIAIVQGYIDQHRLSLTMPFLLDHRTLPTGLSEGLPACTGASVTKINTAAVSPSNLHIFYASWGEHRWKHMSEGFGFQARVEQRREPGLPSLKLGSLDWRQGGMMERRENAA